MDAEYKLIRSVDPTKIRVKIKEKFAKLTLSSYKKKTEINRMNDMIIDQNVNADCYVNPILRTSSSSRISSDVNPDSVDMEPLRVSFSQPNLTQNENIADSLSQRISNLTLNVNPLAHSFNEEKDATKNEIAISLASSGYTSDDAITISDSSTQSERSCDMITSDIPKSGETADAFLPCTFSNDKADRMLAFLRDVSQVRKELEFGGSETTDDTFCPEIAQFSKYSADTVGKKLASADTESMSHNFESISKNSPEETQPMNITNFLLYSSNVVDAVDICPSENRDMKLANDETVANTTVSSIRDLRNSISGDSQSKAQLASCDDDESFLNSSTYSAPSQASITISETSSEAGDPEAPSNLINKETALSTQSQHIQTMENSSSFKKEPEIQQSFASINITAKISIKISITQSNDDTDSNGSKDLYQGEIIAINNSSEDEDLPRALTEDCDSSNNERPLNLAANTGTTNTNAQSHNDDEDPNFMERAQKMLNQLYGKSWQTPEVIRTLSRTESNVKFTPKNKIVTPQNVNKSQLPEDSILDEFSVFRRNIKTNLDSTRTFDETTAAKCKVKRTPKIYSDARCTSAPKKVQQNIKALQTEFGARPKRKGTNYNQRWRQPVTDDCNEASCNAPDDERADKTGDEAHSSSINDSDISWKKSNLSISSSDSESDTRRKRNDNLVFLDLSKDEVEIIGETPHTPLANKDEHFNKRLQQVLRSCKFEDRPKLEGTPKSHLKSKRILFTPNFGNEDEQQDEQPEISLAADTAIDSDNVQIKFQPMPAKFEPFNKQLEAIKTGTPIFKIPSPKPTPKSKSHATKIYSAQKTQLEPFQVCKTPPTQTPIEIDTIKDVYNKYGFLKSLDVCVAKSLCHPDALYYRDNFRLKKEELAKKLHDLYNEKVFENELQVSLIWNKKLLNTAGRCKNKKRLGTRISVVELSEKVLTSADRLRCTLIHELCHAATWIFNGEGGHGATWKYWAHKANTIFPEIPKIGVCHQYDIEYKYTYKCTLCAAKSHAHSKSKKVENIRCSYCHGAIEVYLNKKDKDGNVLPTPVREPKGFAKFVKEKYKEYKRPDLKHADVMKMLSNEFASLKVSNAIKN